MRSALLVLASLLLSACSFEENLFEGQAQAHEGEQAAAAMAEVAFVETEELARMAAAGEVILVDVRTAEEFAEGHLPGAVNMPVGSFDPAAVPVEEGRETVLYCRSGNRSGRAATMLADHWQGTARHLDGGIVAWEAAGEPVVTAAE